MSSRRQSRRGSWLGSKGPVDDAGEQGNQNERKKGRGQSRRGSWLGSKAPGEEGNKNAGPEEVSQTTGTVSSHTTPTGVEGFEMPKWEQPSAVPIKTSVGKRSKSTEYKPKKSRGEVSSSKRNLNSPLSMEGSQQRAPSRQSNTLPPRRGNPEVARDSPLLGANERCRNPLENMVVTCDGSVGSVNDDITFVGDESLGGHHQEEQYSNARVPSSRQNQYQSSPLGPTEEERMRMRPNRESRRTTRQDQQSESTEEPKNFVWKRGPNGRFRKVPVGLDQVNEEEVYTKDEVAESSSAPSRKNDHDYQKAPNTIPSSQNADMTPEKLALLEQQMMAEALEQSKREEERMRNENSARLAEREQEEALVQLAMRQSMNEQRSSARDLHYPVQDYGADEQYERGHRQYDQNPGHDLERYHYRSKDDAYHEDQQYYERQHSAEYYDDERYNSQGHHRHPDDRRARGPYESQRESERLHRSREMSSRERDMYDCSGQRAGYHRSSSAGEIYPGDESRPRNPRSSMERTTSGLSELSGRSNGSGPRVGFFHLPDMGESYCAEQSTASHRSGSTGSGERKNYEWKRGPNGRFIKVPIGGEEHYRQEQHYQPAPRRETEEERLARVEQEMLEKAMKLSMDDIHREQSYRGGGGY